MLSIAIKKILQFLFFQQYHYNISVIFIWLLQDFQILFGLSCHAPFLLTKLKEKRNLENSLLSEQSTPLSQKHS